jgi:predicted  nucleic acid-binding Zn-ribbon protein
MSVSKAHKQEIGHLESKIASLEGENASLTSRAEQLTASVAAAMDVKEQEALAALALANEQASQIEQLELQLIEAQEHGTLALRAREALEETLRQKEGEFEDAKAGFEVEVKKLLQDQNEIILRGRAAEERITELNGRISELANELTDLRSREQVLMQAQHDLEIAEVRNKALTDEVDTLRNRVQEGDLLAEKNLLELKQHFSAHVPPQQYQALVRQTEELKKHIEAMNAELEARDMMVSDLTDLVRLQAAQLEHQAN